MSLTRIQIKKIQGNAAAGELRVAGIEPPQLVFLAQMALEGDRGAWQALETLHASGELLAQAAPRNNTGQPGRYLSEGVLSSMNPPEHGAIPCQS